MDGKTANISFQSPPYNAGKNILGCNKNMISSKYLNDDDNKTHDEYLHLIISFTEISLNFSELTFVNIQQLAGNKKAVIEFVKRQNDSSRKSLKTKAEKFLDKYQK